MGTRACKTYYSVKEDRTNAYHLMIMTPKGANCNLPLTNESVRKSLCSLFEGLKFTYLCPAIEFDYIRERNVVVAFRPFIKRGSLRDVIYQANPLEPTSKKYRIGKPLTNDQVSIWGRQILDSLLFLKSKGISFASLHAGNVLLDENHIRLTDYELDILGYSPSLDILESARTLGHETDITVISFAYLLYEMIMATPLQFIKKKQIYFPDCKNTNVMEVIENILLPKKSVRLRSLQDVVSVPYFASARQIVNPRDESAPFTQSVLDLLDPVKATIPRKKKIKERPHPSSSGPSSLPEVVITVNSAKSESFLSEPHSFTDGTSKSSTNL